MAILGVDIIVLGIEKRILGVDIAILGGGSVSRFREFDQGGSWVVEEPYDITSKVIGWLLDFTQPPGNVKGVVPDGGSNRWESG